MAFIHRKIKTIGLKNNKIKKTLGLVQYNIRHQVTKNIITVLGLKKGFKNLKYLR